MEMLLQLVVGIIVGLIIGCIGVSLSGFFLK